MSSIAEKVKDYNSKHRVLLNEWHEAHKTRYGEVDFIGDGIVCPEEWFGREQRVLFVLKEAYNSEKNKNNSWNLIDDSLNLRNEAGGRIWTSVAEWQYAIDNTTEVAIPLYDNWMGVTSLSNEDYKDKRFEQLRKCAVINVKKSGGNSSSSNDDLETYVSKDADRIRRQIKLIDPTIIICGSTFTLLNKHEILGKPIDDAEKRKRFHIIDDKIIIDFYHPANQFASFMNHYSVVCLYQHALKALSHVV